MGFIDTIKAKAKSDLKTIVLPESEDDRTIKAAEAVAKEGFALPIILGAEEDVKASAERLGVSLEGVKILDNTKSSDIDRYATLLAEIRAKKGMTFDQAKEIILGDRLTFGIMMVKAGDADGLVSGACHTS
ncbi:MAG: phosphate acetyltransferase, partial [Ruminococcaceae bacterium]|nr:phosphate acetyltransferase [Oscillospiraceae bacterium]